MKHSTICQCEDCQGREDFLDALKKFKIAATRLSERWYNDIAHTPDSLAFYPFKESFDEIVHGITEWHDAVKKVQERHNA